MVYFTFSDFAVRLHAPSVPLLPTIILFKPIRMQRYIRSGSNHLVLLCSNLLDRFRVQSNHMFFFACWDQLETSVEQVGRLSQCYVDLISKFFELLLG